jgi:hypothetical protein
MSPRGPKRPIVEDPPQGRAATDEQSLQSRIRQQEALANLGVTALKGTPFEHLLNRASFGGRFERGVRQSAGISPVKRPICHASWDWLGKRIGGKATVGADLASPAGFALRTGKPVISNHLESEQRFRTPDLLAAHGVR